MNKMTDMPEIQKQIKSIEEMYTRQVSIIYPVSPAQLSRLEQQNNQLLERIYDLMLQQHSKVKQYYTHIISLQEQLAKSQVIIDQLNNTKHPVQNIQNLPPEPQLVKTQVKQSNYLAIGQGVYSILHFKDQSSFKESIPYLKAKAEFLQIDQFLRIHGNMEETDRTSSRIELESAYAVNQLNHKIESQVSTIKKMSEDIQNLQTQNTKLKGLDSNHLIMDLEIMKSQKVSLEKQLLQEQIDKKKLQEELNSIKHERGSSKNKPTVIYRR